MKIETNFKIYHFTEQKDFDSYQVETEYRLIDNDINIRLGVLAFQNGQYDLNYEVQADMWAVYADASEGIIEIIYDKIATSDINKIEKYIDIHLDDILDEINEETKKLQAYINNDKDKLKKLLILLSHEFIKNAPSCEFCEQNPCEAV